MKRFSVKIVGEAGQGIKISGKTLAVALKRADFNIFAYTEYPSLIKGGHNTFQIDLAANHTESIQNGADVLLSINKNGILEELNRLNENATIIYDEIYKPEIEKIQNSRNDLKFLPLPVTQIAKENGDPKVMRNTVLLGIFWGMAGLDFGVLEQTLKDYFRKSIDENIVCAKKGYESVSKSIDLESLSKNKDNEEKLVLTANESVPLGAIAAGVRFYTSYPMTPVTGILTNMAMLAEKYKVVIKQAEDEIMAINLVLGAMHVGTRALCATSGGGFDLMSESVSLAGITETPLVVILGQRPGPATGVPTWTTQGDLDLAINAGHGEFTRIVLAPSNPQDAFYEIGNAFNLAERFQTPVIFLLDKYMNESLYLTQRLESNKVPIDRGSISDLEPRYKITENGISARWYPGQSSKVYLANSDEHTEVGYSTEDAMQIKDMMDKRLRKTTTILNELPDAQYIGPENPSKVVVVWGSQSKPFIEAANDLNNSGSNIGVLVYKYLWPLKTAVIKDLRQKVPQLLIAENNATGQLMNLLKKEGVQFEKTFFKYDGRPFWIEEATDFLQ